MTANKHFAHRLRLERPQHELSRAPSRYVRPVEWWKEDSAIKCGVIFGIIVTYSIFA